jgi:hypothetical protein
METILAIVCVLPLLGIAWFGVKLLGYILGGEYEADTNLARINR